MGARRSLHGLPRDASATFHPLTDPPMCGIAGFFGGPPSAHFTEHALSCLASRGPDGSGVWKNPDGSVALVHTRLAILDLSEASSQPMEFAEGDRGQGTRDRDCGSEIVDRRSQMADEDASFLQHPRSPIPDPLSAPSVLVFNGEIYNYRELRRELEAAGETFISDGDTEVLLRLLVREGAACLPKLAGMFAFAFWDEATGTALLARDPLGIKPLYYRLGDGTLAFASEMRVLNHEGDAIDPSALRDYFLWGSVPDSQTLYAANRQLPAGHLLEWKGGEVSIQSWYNLPLGKPTSRVLTNNSAQTVASAALITRAALEESIHRHLVSDVPVGIFLSGGIDSTVILALARQALGPAADIRTFSIGFEDPDYDESGLARRTAEHFGTRHTEWMMTQAEGAAEIAAFLKAMDQPSIDGFNTWCVSKLARREGLKVVLSGLGGDEIFAGYASFERVPRFWQSFRRLGPFRLLMANILNRQAAASPWRRLASFFRGGGFWLEAYHAQRGIFTAEEAAALAGAISGQAVSKAEWELADLPEDPREVVSHLEITRYMRNQLLRDSDVFSMAHGLELRVPFVDACLLNSLAVIPSDVRLRQGKQLLLVAVPEIPEWVRNQAKRGFSFPFQKWMEGQFGDLLGQAQHTSPVPLKAWYRTWAVAVAIRALGQNRQNGKAES